MIVLNFIRLLDLGLCILFVTLQYEYEYSRPTVHLREGGIEYDISKVFINDSCGITAVKKPFANVRSND